MRRKKVSGRQEGEGALPACFGHFCSYCCGALLLARCDRSAPSAGPILQRLLTLLAACPLRCCCVWLHAGSRKRKAPAKGGKAAPKVVGPITVTEEDCLPFQ